jgi:hypothetical protein
MSHATEVDAMLDVIFVAATIAFFILSLAYVKACDRLQ